MMQTAEPFTGNYAIRDCRANPSSRRFLFESKMGSVIVAVEVIIERKSHQVLLVDRNHMVEQIAPATFDATLGNPVLPWILA